MIILKNDKLIRDIVASSGSLGFDGHGWAWEKWLYPKSWKSLDKITVTIKTLTLHPYKADVPSFVESLQTIRPLDASCTSWSNSFGFNNPGIQCWLKDYAPKAEKLPNPYILSISGASYDITTMLKLIEKSDLKNLAAVEINTACPHLYRASDDPYHCISTILISIMNSKTNIPVGLKLSTDLDAIELSKVLKHSNVDISFLSAANSIPSSSELFPNIIKSKETIDLVGDVVWRRSRPYEYVKQLRKVISKNVDIIGGGGVLNSERAERIFEAGAESLSIGSVFVSRPWRVPRIVKDARTF